MNVVCIGSLTFDLFIITKQAPTDSFCIKQGQKQEIDALITHVGGSAANAGATFAQFGFAVYIAGAVGTDVQAEFILRNISALGLHTDLIQHIPGRSAQSIILPFANGDRGILTDRGVQREWSFEATMPLADVVYIGPLPQKPHKSLHQIFAGINSTALVAINPSMEQIEHGTQPLLEYIAQADIVLMNERESSALSQRLGIDSTLSTQQRLLALADYFLTINVPTHRRVSQRTIVITQGQHGAHILANYPSERQIIEQPSLAVTVLSTVGAGDAFGSAFVAARARGSTAANAAQLAANNSAAVIAQIGAHEGILLADQIQQQLEL